MIKIDSKTVISRHCYTPAIETKWRICLLTILNDGTLKNFSTTTRLLVGTEQAL